MANQPTREEVVVAELRAGAAAARVRVSEDKSAGRKTPAWVLALAGTRA